MIRALYENIHIVGWIFASLLLLYVLVYFLVGIIIKRHGISLKQLLIGEVYTFSLIGSMVIFLTLSFPVALAAWLLICFLMNFIFRNNRRLISCIVYCEQNRTKLSRQQLKMLLQLNPCVTSKHIALWIKDFHRLRREVLNKLDSNIHINRLKFKCKILTVSFFVSGIVGIFVTLLAYGNLIENNNCLLMIVLENYAILLCILCILYILLYFSLVGNILHYMYGRKRLFKILFAIFSTIMYIVVTAISMNNGYLF